jgi:surface carbohydrate biosynthesis protein (TIGR04326 family)
MNVALVVWASLDEPDLGLGEVLNWCRYADDPGRTSIPRYLEDHGERLRARYLEFINDLGEQRIDGRRVVEHLDLGDGFSFWWMTWLAEKSPFKSPRIYDCLRLMALEEILVTARPVRLALHGADKDLSLAVHKLCRNLNIDFVWHPTPSRKGWSLSDAYLLLPCAMRGMISLRHLAMKWPLRKLEKPQWFSGRRAVFLCSYFFHLDPAAGAAGCFHPMQWDGLPEHLHRCGTRANWIHHYLRGPGKSPLQTGLRWLGLFNSDSGVQGCHSFLETYMSWRVLLRAFWRWVRLNTAAFRLRRIDGAFQPRGSAVCLWPLLRNDWDASLRGPAAMNNCLWVELFDTVLGSLPRQETGLYLWENQGWECAMLHAWRRHGHGRIIGVPHATVAFWHLNNFDDPRSLASRERCSKPLPDRLAINGPMARSAFIGAGGNSDRFVEVEALRYQYLAEPASTRSTGGRNAEAGSARSSPGKLGRILVLGDFTLRQTIKMLRCLEHAFHLSRMEFSVTLKPHPACRIVSKDYPSLTFEQTSQRLPELWPHFDLVFSSNTTSAGLEALLAGLPVVVYLDEDDFNHSPLRGIDGVRFAANAADLVAALEQAEPCVPPPALEDFFWLDRRLPRWTQLLSSTVD